MDLHLVILACSVLLFLLIAFTKKEKFAYVDNFLDCIVDCQTNAYRVPVLVQDGNHPTEYCIETCRTKYGMK
jgi:hypothetical protein